MAQEHIDFTVPGGDDVTSALHKAEDNFNDLYAQAAGVVPYSGLRNLLINGDGRFNQRVFAGGSLAANKYGYDRWRTLGSASSFTVGSTTISLNGTICQVVEAPDIANATVTVSVSNPTGPITVALQPDGTTATSATGTIAAGSGIKSVTLAVPSSLTGNVFLLLTTSAVVTFDGPAKRAGIQLEMGSVASPFERRLFALELALCQRYYEKSYDVAVSPSSVTTSGATNLYISGLPSAVYANTCWTFYKVTKRALPTVTTYSPATGASSKVRDNTANADVPLLAWANAGTMGGGAYYSLSASATSINTTFHWAADAEF